MATELLTKPQPTQAPDLSVDEPELRTIQIGGRDCQTNLPAGVDLFEPAYDLSSAKIEPSKLDDLSAGEYTFSSVKDRLDFDSGQTRQVPDNRNITVRMGSKGKVVDATSFTSDWFHLGTTEGVDKLMSALGFEVKEDNGYRKITAVPTPDTLKSAAGLLGVDIKLFPGKGKLEGPDYLGAFAAGQYPVATGTEYEYEHDSDDDHITAMVLGGEPLRDALKEVAQKALASKDDQIIKDITFDIDRFTNSLRLVTAFHPELSAGEAYGKEQGRRTLIKQGEAIGLDADTVSTILETAQKNAKTFGFKEKPLD